MSGDTRSKPAASSTSTVGTVEAPADRRDVTKKKVIERLKALAPSLLASGALLDARPSSLEPPLPRDARKK
ncbi:hypothetical protein [Anaeromyxobacter diazotrophicus]|uniref:Uncharacterized protein n=1 Tax=Anaeromyxobacter diazotrophicus TaxID=2590199 RepID=A0A7I9VJI5_9BACT|nr:hypothetical protein [Anaeromyxobacter diazotrophicus]GEJ56533.1 hypothetical protein AMYX_12740 [Anaeromyxobacter diazotrophicus]